MFSFLCLIQQVMIISLMITKRMEPRTMATMMTLGTESLFLALFSDAENYQRSELRVTVKKLSRKMQRIFIIMEFQSFNKICKYLFTLGEFLLNNVKCAKTFYH